MKTENNLYLLRITFVAALGGLLFGFDTGVISGALPYMREYFQLNDYQEGLTVSSLIFGCIIGLLFSGKPGDLLGRKRILIVTSILFFISAIGSAAATNLWEMITYRFIGGLAVGIASAFSPMYISEISPAAQRGKMVSLNQLTIVIGIFISFYSNYLFVGIGEDNWRFMLGIEGLFAIIFFFALFWVPESPRWLMQKGKDDNALDILERVNGKENADIEIARIRTSIKNFKNISYKELFSARTRPLLFIGLFIAIFSQITGINAIMYYAPTIFIDIGFNAESALLQQTIIGFINLIFTFVAIYLIDKFGRKPLLLYGVSGMLISLTVITTAYFLRHFEGLLIFLFILIYIASFAASLGPVSWVLISEIFPNNIRSKAMTIAVMGLWGANILVTQFFPMIRDRFGGEFAFLIFAIASAILLIFIYLKVPETKGKSLEELELELLRINK